MTTIDILEKIIVPLIAAGIGAILAFRYQNTLELKREKRQILQVLMMYRNAGANELDWIKALNAVDVVFHDEKNIRALLHTFFSQTEKHIIQNQQYWQTYNQMLLEMARSIGYKDVTLQDIRDFYAPEALKWHYPLKSEQTEPKDAAVTSDVLPNT
ncbi:DUF6680 family protein [Ferruginibacter sp. SUN002]|uniref:DUF6680 family protein n=1 Tax=Ferruginibacter sp. SUN002 TaxID=2937789 RepID=UPI003D360B1D